MDLRVAVQTFLLLSLRSLHGHLLYYLLFLLCLLDYDSCWRIPTLHALFRRRVFNFLSSLYGIMSREVRPSSRSFFISYSLWYSSIRTPFSQFSFARLRLVLSFFLHCYFTSLYPVLSLGWLVIEFSSHSRDSALSLVRCFTIYPL